MSQSSSSPSIPGGDGGASPEARNDSAPRRFFVILNDTAGTLARSRSEEQADQIRQRFHEHGVQADVRFVPGDQLAQTARAAIHSDVDAIIAGGGDGTLNTVASALLDSDKPFGVLPLGTHNHFAKDLNMPLELDQAIDALAGGDVATIPVGMVNRQIFLNFSGIGLHPEVIRHRDAQRQALNRDKWVAMIVAMAKMMWRFPLIPVRLRVAGQVMFRRSPSVLVCNNEHQIRAFGVENTSSISRDVLNIYVARASSRKRLIWLFLSAFLGRLEQARDFEALAVKDVWIDVPRRRHLRISVDGEITDMRPPLHYRVHERGLKVIRPRVAPP